ncbi:MAG: hypothetical protein J5606_02270 [Bacteroidales bacterium]|nr:hypothetical protein [Bacteroidales bacterium]
MKKIEIIFLTILLCGAVNYCYGNTRQCCSFEICQLDSGNTAQNSTSTEVSSTAPNSTLQPESTSPRKKPSGNGNKGRTQEINGRLDTLNLQIDSLKQACYTLQKQVDSLGTLLVKCQEQLNNENENGNIGAKISWLFVIVFLIIGALAVYIVIVRKKQRENIIKTVLDSGRLKDWRNAAEVTIDKSQLMSAPKSYDSEISDLQKRIADLEDIEKQHKKNNTEPDKEQGKSIKPEEKKLYAVSIIDGYLQRVKDSANEDTVFELCLKGTSKADITIYKSAYEKILDNPTHLEGCDKQIVGKTSIKVEQVGEAVTDDNGRWRVVKPLKVLVK